LQNSSKSLPTRNKNWYDKSKCKREELHMNSVPKHVAIIMDGNGRWAKERGLPRTAGHKAGMDSIKEIVETAHDIGVKSLTLYAFSTENWTRSEEEVRYLMGLPGIFLKKELRNLIKQEVRIHRIGFNDNVPSHTL